MSDTDFPELDKRVSSLETYFKVGLIVAAVFGISGGFGALALNSARTQIAGLQDKVTQAQIALTGVTDNFEEVLTTQRTALETATAGHLLELGGASETAETSLVAKSEALQSELANAVNLEVATQIVEFDRIRVHRVDEFMCSVPDKPATGQWAEICRHEVQGNFPDV